MSFWPLLVLQVVVFVVLVVGLRRILSRNLTNAAAHLQGLNAEYLRRHEELKQRTEQAERQYGEQTVKAKTESEHILQQARQEAESLRAKTLEDARQESERIVQQGIQSRDAIRTELEESMERRAIERACELLQTTLPTRVRQEIQSGWLEELLRDGLGQLDRLKTHQEDAREARVVSALPLADGQREALRRRLREAVGREIAVQEETDQRLVAGMTITVGSLILDGSLFSRIQQAAREAQKLS